MPNTEYLKEMGKHNLESRKNFLSHVKGKTKEHVSKVKKKTLMVSDMGYKDLLHPS